MKYYNDHDFVDRPKKKRVSEKLADELLEAKNYAMFGYGL